MELSGVWKNVVTYGKQYGKYQGEQLICLMDIQCVDDEIQGFSQDKEGFGVNTEIATIRGKIRDNNIVLFYKEYPARLYINSEFTPKTNKLKQKSLIVEYIGKIDDSHKNIAGTWKIEDKFYFLGFIPINFTVRGIWEMNKLT